MKLTKFEHACFVVDLNGQSLIVDPGGFTTNLVVPDNVVCVIVTHEHADHLDKDNLQAIKAKNPVVVVVAHESITSQLDDFKTQSVMANEGIKIGNFELEFYGGEHAVINPEWPTIPNLGVLINGQIYYPGDSFVAPEREVAVLALPVSAPWLKISETMAFLQQVKPQLAFPTHDAILSDVGKGLPDRMLPAIAEQVGTKYQRLTEPLVV